jgi:putative ABC transport system permease protein
MFAIIALRDLEFRRRRFFVAVIAVGLVFGIALLLSGLSGAFYNESRRVVGGLGADQWLVADGTTGPFTSTRLVPDAALGAVAASPGVESVSRLLVSSGVADDRANANLLGLEFGTGHDPTLDRGRLPEAAFEVVVDESLADISIGDSFGLGGQTWTVVGETSGQRFFAGVPVVFARHSDVQLVQLDGAPASSAFLVSGALDRAPAGLLALSSPMVIADLDRPLESAADTIDMVRILLWLVAAGIIGTLVYLTALERVRDFAVLKATGSATGSLLAGLLLQAALIALIASVIAAVIAQLLAPIFPMFVEMPGSAYVALPIVALAIAGLASVAGIRRVLAVDPALAFGA